MHVFQGSKTSDPLGIYTEVVTYKECTLDSNLLLGPSIRTDLITLLHLFFLITSIAHVSLLYFLPTKLVHASPQIFLDCISLKVQFSNKLHDHLLWKQVYRKC